MGFSVGMVGVGAFARSFIPLFLAHPLVDVVALCDHDTAKLAAAAREYGIARTYPSLDALCRSDVDAAVVITQNWLHAPQAVQALRAGKHVYSAVPPGITLEEIATLVRTVEETGLVYGMHPFPAGGNLKPPGYAEQYSGAELIRRTIATAGLPLRFIAKVMGHTNATTTERYARPDQVVLERVREALNRER